jgi:asparagine synthase (glutamine-hydrolysing)
VYGLLRLLPGPPAALPDCGIAPVFAAPELALGARGFERPRVLRRGERVVALAGDLDDGSGDPRGGERSLETLHDLWARDRLAAGLASFRGSFLLAACDLRARRLWLAGDRHGTRGLHFGRRSGELLFAPGLAPFRAAGFEPDPDPGLALELLSLGYLLSRRTWLRGVAPLPPGVLVRLDAAGEEATRFWQWRSEPAPGPAPDEGEAARELGRRLVAAVERRARGAARLVVPLSGGLDSRALLAALLELRPAREIETWTFGSPGTWDFELGRRVARSAGTRHTSLDLAREPLREQDLLRQARECDGAVELVQQVPLPAWEGAGASGTRVLVGFMGDPLMGSKLDPADLALAGHPAAREEELALRLLGRHLVAPEAAVAPLLRLDEKEAKARLLAAVQAAGRGLEADDAASFHEAWDIANRQPRYVRPCVFPLPERFDYRAPFLDADLVELLRTAPRAFRLGSRLYRRALCERFPRLFSLPTKNERGLALQPGALARLRRRAGGRALRALEAGTRGRIAALRWQRERARRRAVNYLDWSRVLRGDSPNAQLLLGCLERLARQPLVDGRALLERWREHRAGRADHARLLLGAVSLELALRAFAAGEPEEGAR